MAEQIAFMVMVGVMVVGTITVACIWTRGQAKEEQARKEREKGETP